MEKKTSGSMGKRISRSAGGSPSQPIRAGASPSRSSHSVDKTPPRQFSASPHLPARANGLSQNPARPSGRFSVSPAFSAAIAYAKEWGSLKLIFAYYSAFLTVGFALFAGFLLFASDQLLAGASLLSLGGAVLALVGAGLVFGLALFAIGVWVEINIIDSSAQSFTRGRVSHSDSVSKANSKLPAVAAVAIIGAVLSFALSFATAPISLIPLGGLVAPVVHFLLSLLLGMALLFVPYRIILRDAGLFDSFGQGVGILSRNPLQCLILIAVEAAVSIAAIAVGAIPGVALVLIGTGAFLQGALSGWLLALTAILMVAAMAFFILCASFAKVATAAMACHCQLQMGE
ncbi:hypothetical protein HY995_03590 [Candidatus Micrarchaeota archaeon]|nr:hypothetical protein [Candidatus Micrarchaeota archaeon]